MSEFKNKHRGEVIVVLGCGPSVNDLSLYLLEGVVTVGANLIGRAYHPDYLFWLDQNVTPGARAAAAFEEFARSPARKFVAREVPREHALETFENYEPEDGEPLLSSDLERGLYWSRTALFPAINMACILGAARVVLAGVDLRDRSHFYSSEGRGEPHPEADRILRDFERLAEFADERGVEVVNVNPRSAVRCFEFADLKAAVRRST